MNEKPNGILMADSIREEGTAANKENRIPSSSNAIAIFRKKSQAKLSTSEIHELFDIVFGMINEISKGKVCNSISRS